MSKEPLVKEYEPGLTELRLNAKSNLVNLQKVFDELGKCRKQIQQLSNHVTDIQKENVALRQEMQTMRAKLYENGIR